MTRKRILIGEITTVHGVKGLVKIRAYAEDESLFDAPLFTEESGSKTISVSLKSMLKGDWLAEVENVTDRNEAEKLRGTQLYIDRGAMPETDDGEFYIEDLKGMKVVDKEGKEIGTVLSVENYGASDLLDIKPSSGPSFYLPFTDDVIVDVNFEKATIKVERPEEI